MILSIWYYNMLYMHVSDYTHDSIEYGSIYVLWCVYMCNMVWYRAYLIWYYTYRHMMSYVYVWYIYSRMVSIVRKFSWYCMTSPVAEVSIQKIFQFQTQRWNPNRYDMEKWGHAMLPNKIENLIWPFKWDLRWWSFTWKPGWVTRHALPAGRCK